MPRCHLGITQNEKAHTTDPISYLVCTVTVIPEGAIVAFQTAGAIALDAGPGRDLCHDSFPP